MKRLRSGNVNTKEFWDSYWGLEGPHRKVNTGYYARLASVINRGDRVLDIGCGIWDRHWRNAPIQLFSVDLSFVACRGSALHGALPTQADAQALPFADASFDVVLSAETLEHLEDPQRAISEMVRTCVDGGWVTLGTPLENRASDRGEHVWSFSAADMMDLLSPFGSTTTEIFKAAGGEHIVALCHLRRN